MADKFVGNFQLGGQGRTRPGAIKGSTLDMKAVQNAEEALTAYIRKNGIGATNAVNPKAVRHGFGRGVPADSVLALESESQNED